jgi:glutathione S-transferase
MSEAPLILHHYPASPFSEKARLMLGFKGLAWRSVHVPTVAPKPDVVALTGGYRRTPLLQIGADVYCDTALIARVLEALRPKPTLFPHEAPLAGALAQWADSTLFWIAVPYTMQPAGAAAIFAGAPPEAMQVFREDRAAFTAGMTRRTVADATAQLHGALGWLDAALADGRPFVLGPVPSIADFSIAHCIWYIRRAPPVAGILEPHRALLEWSDRMAAIGHGSSEPMKSAEAIALAAAARSHAPTVVEPGLRFEAGQAVTVTPIDYGRDPVAGTLVGLSNEEVVVRRADPRAGTLHVHFPRAGFQLKAEPAGA